MSQVAQIVGAVLILAGFAGAQFRVLDPQSARYLFVNLVGSVILTVVAARDGQLGFLLLEGVWAVVSLWGLIALVRNRQDT